MRRIIVSGLGPGNGLLVPDFARRMAREHPTLLRTKRHPSASLFGDLESFDSLYESQATISDVYAAIVERLISETRDSETIGYLVPGSPLVAERTVELLRSRPEVDVEVIPCVSFLDLVWSRLEIDPFKAKVTLIDGQNFESEIVGVRGAALVSQCDNQFVLSDIKLALDGDSSHVVKVMQRLGMDDEHIFEVEWNDLDRIVRADHLTSLWIPELPQPGEKQEVDALRSLVAQLRAECPWDRAQTHQSLVPGLLEEANEVVSAIEALDLADGSFDHLVEELGDLLFHIFLQSAIGEENGSFDLDDVAAAVSAKMVRRHPHIFERKPGSPMPSLEELADQWKAIKASENND